MAEKLDFLKGLVISEPWISRILDGEKSWEMRSTVTLYRGPMALIRKGSGSAIGLADLVDCIPCQREAEYEASEPLHCIPKAQQKECAEKWPVAWVFANARYFAEPVPYKHKKGAQSQVLLSSEESMAVGRAPTRRNKIPPAIPSLPIENNPPIVEMRSLGHAELKLTTASIQNNYISVRSVRDLFPPELIGGSTKASAAQMLTVIFQGYSFQSDVTGGSKWILRNRRETREFFLRTGAKAGDDVVVDRLAEYVFSFRIKGKTS